ncbi:MAG: dTDP-4-dehydrorhamnose reductase [Anaerolineaceae bacterium]|jgi:dTDP-4-dehydrorhamnose reductase|nr:MAG: dTDP-4-dehydrorhamnose reductase [Anaerolineaceae bacterium]
MRILLLAKNGQLGWELHRALLPLGDVTAVDFPQINLEQPDTYVGLIREVKPNLIVNPAAYTAVDLAETERERARNINAAAAGILAEEAKRLDAILVHYSTDYVFDGKKGALYIEDDEPNPLNMYGLSKLEGERAIQAADCEHLILRTCWVYSMRMVGGFVAKVLEWSRRQTQLRMVTDQVSNPTWARTLAEITALLLSRGDGYLRERTGLYHLAGGGYASRYEWAQKILELDPKKEEQTATEMLPALTSDFPTPAERPLFSALDCSKFESAFNLKIPDWKTALELAMR